MTLLRYLAFLLLTLNALWVGGCGQTGKLYLPDDNTEETQSS
jgi:predicted small lipoprotein YifL